MALANALNAPLPLGASQGGTGLATLTAHAVLLGEGTGTLGHVTLTDGQLLIGSTGADPVGASLTAGANITLTPGAGSLTIAATSAGLPFTNVTTTTQTMAPNNGYLANNAALVTLTLPTTAAQFTLIEVAGSGAGGWSIAQSAGQNIQVGSASTTAGTGGSLSSTNQYDSIILLCTVANTTWVSLGGPQGNLDIV